MNNFMMYKNFNLQGARNAHLQNSDHPKPQE